MAVIQLNCWHYMYISYCILLPTDINECADTSENNCSSNANCTDTTGSYNCTCQIGYSGNGYTCDGKFLMYRLSAVFCTMVPMYVQCIRNDNIFNLSHSHNILQCVSTSFYNFSLHVVLSVLHSSPLMYIVLIRSV